MNNSEAREWLDAAWNEALEVGDTDPDPDIDRLTNSKVVSIRYALVTQMLGKIAHTDRSLLTLQLAGGGAGTWDPRSFSTAVIVPWVADNHNVLGKSPDPYVNNPLRVPRIVRDRRDARDTDEWNALFDFLAPLDEVLPKKLEDAFKRVLASLGRKLAEQTFAYPIPPRVSLPQLMGYLGAFLEVASGGLRPLAVATALFKILGNGFSLFDDVQAQGVNEADIAGGMPGDIMCRNDGELFLVVEVKDQDLTLADARATTRKANESGTDLSDLLFAVPDVRQQDQDEIRSLSSRNWAAGLNIYTVSLQGLSYHSFALLKEEWRIRFVREICTELDDRLDQAARKSWHDILLEH